jgi:hypothetical protein
VPETVLRPAATTGTTHRIRVAVCGGILIGYAVSGPPESEEPEGAGVIRAVYLLPSSQGIGAWRLLVEAADRPLPHATRSGPVSAIHVVITVAAPASRRLLTIER